MREEAVAELEEQGQQHQAPEARAEQAEVETVE
jgi:hypothetical protein